jgi:DNA-binding transcriptional LysR family regulator
MNAIDVWSIDLNLLRVLAAVLETNSFTRAGAILSLGQPAVSHAISRLRVLLADELFVRSGRGIVATPRVEMLRLPLKALLADAALMLAHDSAFEPATSQKTFTLVCPDLLAPVVAHITSVLNKLAPRCRLEVVQPDNTEHATLSSGAADLALLPKPTEARGLYVRQLGNVHFAVIVRKGHPAVKSGQLSREAYVNSAHILVRTGGAVPSIVGGELQKARVNRHIALVVPTFLGALFAASESDLLFTGPLEVVRPLLARFGLQAAEVPVPMPSVPVAALWHERYQADAASKFFRDVVVQEVAKMLAGSSSMHSARTLPSATSARKRKASAQ